MKDLLFAERDEYEIGSDYGRGWIVLRPADSGVRLAVGERGLGHDEPSMLHGLTLTYEEAAELRDALSAVVPEETAPTETRQWSSPTCDICGESIRSSKEFAAGSYPARFGREKSGQWHIGHAPKAFLDRVQSW